jgi:hypothetical protein
MPPRRRAAAVPPSAPVVFISHSSANGRLAARVEKILVQDGLDAWLDQSDIRVGTLLRNELHASIKSSRLVVLLWSKAAAASRWVAAEILAAFHLRRFIVPAVVDGTALPYFLENSIFLDLQRRPAATLAGLSAVVRRAPKGANEVPAFRDSPSAEARQMQQTLSHGQRGVTDSLVARDLARARELQKLLDGTQRLAERRFALDATILSLAGYHRKNAYMAKHWHAIQAGRPPKDPLLVKAERCFFDALFVNPRDYYALNGLGSILIFERDLPAAEFFVRRALEHARRAGLR